MEQVLEAQMKLAADGRRSVMGRVIDLKGFSTLPADELVLIDEDGGFHGSLLGRPGADRLGAAAREQFAGAAGLVTVGVEIHGPQVDELGLSCGGRADVLLQPVGSIPAEFWTAIGARAPIALVTVLTGPGAGPAAVAVDRSGSTWGTLDASVDAKPLVSGAIALLREGRTAQKRVDLTEDPESPAGQGRAQAPARAVQAEAPARAVQAEAPARAVQAEAPARAVPAQALIEAWVPAPRIVVVGSGDIVTALEAQAGLLGWEVRAVDGRAALDQVGGLLEWAGATGALVVCSHDPHVDSPALATGLASGVPYVGAMGSRGTQSRRVERLRAGGVADADIERIHRPIGLNLGGRRAPEVALSIVAEILACHCGRDGGALKDTTGPIHG
jgi:xanthine dehydrogenase accessory factor